MADIDDRKVVNKTTVLEELEYWNVLLVFRRLNIYYRNKLRHTNIKNLQGMEASDFSMYVLEKIISNDISWQRSTRSSFIDFCYDTASGLFSHWLRECGERQMISMDSGDDFIPDFHKADHTKVRNMADRFDYYGF